MINGAVLVILALETISDIRTGTISALRMIIFIIIAGAVNLIFYYQPVWSMLGGMAIGALLFVYAVATSESIGYGDCLVFVCVGAFIGFARNLQLLFFSLLTAAIVGGIYSLIRKKGIKARVPFIPYILAAYLALTIIEIINGGMIL